MKAFFNFIVANNPARISPKENSGASGGFLPRLAEAPAKRAKPLLLRLRLPNSKINQPRQSGKSFFPRKIVFPLCQVRIEAPPPVRSVEGRDPQKNVLILLEKIGRAQKQKSGEHFSAGHASGASGGGAASFVQFPLEKSSRKVYNYSTSKEFASGFGSPRFARRPNCKGFWAKKSIGGFAFWGKKIF